MTASGHGIGGVLALMVLGCGLDPVDGGNVFPNNCGAVGPVDVFEVGEIELDDETRWGPFPEMDQAGPNLLLQLHTGTLRDADIADARSEIWVVDECGANPSLLYDGPYDSPTRYGTAGPHVLSCDEDSGAMHWIDPTGDRSPRLLFPGAHDCRVFPSGRGLMAQKRDSGTVWYVADPSDPRSPLVVVTRDAKIIQSELYGCFGNFACEGIAAYDDRPRFFDDTILVLLADERLVQYDVRSGHADVLSAGPVRRFGELEDNRYVAISHHLWPDGFVDRLTGQWTDACCLSGLNEMRQIGKWLTWGSSGPPPIPVPEEWANFRAWHLETDVASEVVGPENWSPRALLTADTLIVDVSPSWTEMGEEGRFIVWPATGERERVVLPGDAVWSIPGHDGVLSHGAEQGSSTVWALGARGEAPKTVLRDKWVHFATTRGDLVFSDPVDPLASVEANPLRIMTRDGEVTGLDARSVEPFAASFPSDHRWPADIDDVVYVAEDDGRYIVRRTVLPGAYR